MAEIATSGADLQITLALNAEQVQAALARVEQQSRQVGSVWRTDVGASFSGAIRTIAGGIAPFAAVGGAIAAAAAGMAHLGMASLEASHRVDEHINAIRGLNGAYGLIDRATAGAVTAEQAFAVQQQLTQSGLEITGEQLAVVTRAAREFAGETNTTLSAALERLSGALISGSRGALRQFGVEVDVGASRGTTFGNALRTLADRQRGVATATQNAGEQAAAMRRQWGTMIDGMLAALGRAGPIGDFLQLVSRALGALGEHFENQANRARQNAEDNARANTAEQRAREGVIRLAAVQETMRDASLADGQQLEGLSLRQLDMIRQQAREARAQHQDQTAGNVAARVSAEQNIAILRNEIDTRATAAANARVDTEITEQTAARRAAIEERVTALTGQAQDRLLDREAAREARRRGIRLQEHHGNAMTLAQQIQLTQQVAEAETGLRRYGMEVDASLRRRAGEGWEAYGDRVEAVLARVNAQLRRQQEFLQQVDSAVQGATDLAARREEGAEASRRMLDNLAAGYAGLTDAQIEARQRDSQQKSAELENEQREQRQRLDAGIQFQNSFADIMRGTGTLAQQGARVVRGAFDTMTSSFKSHLAALITGRETLGEALRGMLHETLLNLATEAAVQSLMNLARGFAMLASQNYPAAAQSFTAAALFGGVAVAAGVGAAVTAPAQSSAAPAGAGGGADRGPASAGVGAGGGAGGGGMTVVSLNVNSALATREDVQDGVRRALDFGAVRGSIPILQRESENMRAA